VPRPEAETPVPSTKGRPASGVIAWPHDTGRNTTTAPTSQRFRQRTAGTAIVCARNGYDARIARTRLPYFAGRLTWTQASARHHERWSYERR
jgi:hypothetical protein